MTFFDLTLYSSSNQFQDLADAKSGIESIASATINIQAALNSTTESLHELATLGSYAVNLRVWLPIMALFIGVWKANDVLAGYLMALGCKWASLECLNSIDNSSAGIPAL